MTDQTWPPEVYLNVSGIPSYRKDGANGPYVCVLCADRNVQASLIMGVPVRSR